MSASDWRAFILDYGKGAEAADLALVVGVPAEEIRRFRDSVPDRGRSRRGLTFRALFLLWHGREPEPHECPAPRVRGSGWGWSGDEEALLEQLWGAIGVAEISRLLSFRLQQCTGDPTASRSRTAVQLRANRLGLVSSDLRAGITVRDAADEIGSLPIVQHAISNGDLPAWKVGRLWSIPRAEWEAWKARRVLPPEGYVPLAGMRERLGIRSDKLSEFARAGLIPDAVLCMASGDPRERAVCAGSWWVPASVATELVQTRARGGKMPWHGAGLVDNVRKAYQRWLERRHPDSCPECRIIWGDKPAPSDFSGFLQAYRELSHGQRRHLTRRLPELITSEEVSQRSGQPITAVRASVANGTLTEVAPGQFRKADVTRWIARKCPDGDSRRSWMGIKLAAAEYGIRQEALALLCDRGEVPSRSCPSSGDRQVLRHGLFKYFETRGYSREQAKALLCVNDSELDLLMTGLAWESEGRITGRVLEALKDRHRVPKGFTPVEAARRLGLPTSEVQSAIDKGLVKLKTDPWAPHRPYLSKAMVKRVWAKRGATPETTADDLPPGDWAPASEAAQIAGVTAGTLGKWAMEYEVKFVDRSKGRYFEVRSLRRKARRYWANPPRQVQASRMPAWISLT